RCFSVLDHAEDVVLAEDERLFAVELDLGARVLAEEDAVALLDVELPHRAVLEQLAVADGEHRPLDRLLLRGVRDVEPALGLLLFLHPTNDHAILQRPDLHSRIPPGALGRPNVVRDRRTSHPAHRVRTQLGPWPGPVEGGALLALAPGEC